MSSRNLLILFGVVIIAGVIALLVAARTDSATPKVASTAPASTSAADPTPPIQTSRPRPKVASNAPAADDSPQPPTVYMTDGGVLVRDHRADRSKPPSLKNLPGAPINKPRQMTPKAVVQVRNALRPMVRRCEDQQPAGDLGPDPRLEAVVTVSVHDGKLTVDGISAHTKDVANTKIGNCVEDAFQGVVLDVPGEPDIDHFPQTHPFRLGGR